MLQYCSKFWLEGTKKYHEKIESTDAQQALIKRLCEVLSEMTNLSPEDAHEVAKMWVRTTMFKNMPRIRYQKTL